jgi:hypothetical protein
MGVENYANATLRISFDFALAFPRLVGWQGRSPRSMEKFVLSCCRGSGLGSAIDEIRQKWATSASSGWDLWRALGILKVQE